MCNYIDDDLVIDENSEILSIPSDGKEKNGNREIERLSSPDGSYETSNEKETSNEQLVNLEISTGQNGVDVIALKIFNRLTLTTSIPNAN